MVSSTVTAESLAERVKSGGIAGHRAFDYLAEVANGQPAIRPLFEELETEISSGAITLKPYPETMPRSLLQSFLDLFPKRGNLPPDNY